MTVSNRAGDRIALALIDRPDGLDINELATLLGYTQRETVRAGLRALRLNHPDLALVGKPRGKKQPWVWTLTATYDDSADWWITNRRGDLLTRMDSIRAVAENLPGPEARVIAKHMRRALEDVKDEVS